MIFASASANFHSHARTKVDKVSHLLETYSHTVVAITGFIDNQGGFKYNKKLSNRRAHTLADILSIHGKPYTKNVPMQKK